MDKDRIEGVIKQAEGSIADAVGKTPGDAEPQSLGAAKKAEGKIRNAVGGVTGALAS